jgi:hypothetical protein
MSTVTTSTINRRSTIKGVDTTSPIPGNRIIFTPFHHKIRTPMVNTDVRIAAIISKVSRRCTDLNLRIDLPIDSSRTITLTGRRD